MSSINVRSRRVWIPGLIALAFVSIMVVRMVQAGQSEGAQPTVEQIRAERGVSVTVAEVMAAPLEVWREYSGSVSGVNEGVVRARTGDQVSAVPVTVGSRVSRGQVVVRQAGQGTEARVRQAQAARNQAQRTAERLRPLHEAGAISDQEWEGALTQLELATADLAAASDMLSLTSPLTGTVTEVIARPGMIPAAGDPLVRVADLSRLAVYLRVSAAQAAELREGQPARTAVSGEGQVQRVALQADPATRLVEVEVIFPPAAGLIPGTLATVQVGVASREQAVQVPRQAVREGGFVWVVGADSRVARREVTTGLQGREVVEVVSGVQPGDRVVVEGGAFLTEGALVRVVNPGAAGGGDV
jgi:membrane fusion protein, multidrug efflux system